MLDKDIKFYKENRDKFKEQYANKYIVIKNKKVLGVYDTHAQAYTETTKHHDVGTFIIEHVKTSSRS